jgi:hypothetical protein
MNWSRLTAATLLNGALNMQHSNRTTAAPSLGRAFSSGTDVPRSPLFALGAYMLKRECPVALEVPMVFLLDELRWQSRLFSRLNPTNEDSLLAEFMGVFGYAFEWGYVIERRPEWVNENTETPRLVMWHIVPTCLWLEMTQHFMHLPLRIPDLINLLFTDLIRLVYPVVPDWIIPVNGKAHDLFALSTSEAEHNARARRWMANQFLPRHLPTILAGIRPAIIRICQEMITQRHVTSAPSKRYRQLH